MQRKQATDRVLMVRPAAFGFNPEAAATNVLQHVPDLEPETLKLQAQREFDGLVGALTGAGVQVSVQHDLPEPLRPDAVFPNNWVSFHEDGSLVLYPMQPQSRRSERRRELVEAAAQQLGFKITRLVDLSEQEQRGEFLEGTGSLVLDHVRRTAYACRSPRTSEALVERWCRLMGYDSVLFDATDLRGTAYYHTNVMLSIGTKFAVVAADAINARDRQSVLRALELSGREIIQIDRSVVRRFGGNILELSGRDAQGEPASVLAMSVAAHDALGDARLARLASCVDSVVAVPVPRIEQAGGGSVRCMLAEVFVAL